MQIGLMMLDGRPIGTITASVMDGTASSEFQLASYSPPSDGDVGSDDGSGAMGAWGRRDGSFRERGAFDGGPRSRPSRRGPQDHFTSDKTSVPDETAVPFGGDRVYGDLAAARDRARQELRDKPWLNEKAIHIFAGENPDPHASTALWESAINRMAVRGTSLEQQLRRHAQSGLDEGGYYAGYHHGPVDPRTRHVIEQSRDRALNYSNISNYATDNSSGGLAARENYQGTFIDRGAPFHGEHFKGPDTRIPEHQREWRKLIHNSEEGRKSAETQNSTAAAGVE